MGAGIGCQTSPVNVRSARVGDELEVAGVHVPSWQAVYRGLLPDSYLENLRPEDRAARYTFGRDLSEESYTIVAVVEGAIRGFAATGSAESDYGSGELLALYVDPGLVGP